MTEVPEGDWFCSVCVSQVSTRTPSGSRGAPQFCPHGDPLPVPPQAEAYRDPISPRRGKKRKRGRLLGGGSAEEEESPRRRAASRRHEGQPPPRHAAEGLSPAKRRGATLRSQPSDLTFCE